MSHRHATLHLSPSNREKSIPRAMARISIRVQGRRKTWSSQAISAKGELIFLSSEFNSNEKKNTLARLKYKRKVGLH